MRLRQCAHARALDALFAPSRDIAQLCSIRDRAAERKLMSHSRARVFVRGALFASDFFRPSSPGFLPALNGALRVCIGTEDRGRQKRGRHEIHVVARSVSLSSASALQNRGARS